MTAVLPAEQHPYLGFWITSESHTGNTTWSTTTAHEDRGSRYFGLIERVPWPTGRGWPEETEDLARLLMRRGPGITRALIALNAIPNDQQEKHNLPQSGPPYDRDVEDARLGLLVLKALRNLHEDFGKLNENRVDIRGIGELLDIHPNRAEVVRERLTEEGLIEQVAMGLSDGFGPFRATSAGFAWLEENGAELPAVAQGFVLFPN